LSMDILYWRFFNFLVRRVLAVVFGYGGPILSLYGLPNVLLGADGVAGNGAERGAVVYSNPKIIDDFTSKRETAAQIKQPRRRGQRAA